MSKLWSPCPLLLFSICPLICFVKLNLFVEDFGVSCSCIICAYYFHFSGKWIDSFYVPRIPPTPPKNGKKMNEKSFIYLFTSKYSRVTAE